VSKSWKLAAEATKFYAPCVDDILVQIAEKFGRGEYPIIYHKLLKNLKPNPSYFCFRKIPLVNNFKSIAKLVSQNMKGLKSIVISTTFHDNIFVIADEIYEKFIIEFLPNSKNTLCELQIPKLFLPNVCFPNLTKITLEEMNPFDIQFFKNQFSQILGNVPDLKVIQIQYPKKITKVIRDYLISNYAEQCLVSSQGIIPFPVKIIRETNFNQLVSYCQFKLALEYVEIGICSVDPDEYSWNNFMNNIDNFRKLKGIHFWDVNSCQEMEESDFYKPESLLPPKSETFYNIWAIWPSRIQLLKSHGIQILNHKEFNFQTEKLPKNFKWVLKFGAY
jgi:UDP-N-acetylglucosamine transferase subunit ALG13